MHPAKELTSGSFRLTHEGQPASLFDIFPGFEERDRLGVVVQQPGGALGASALILASITTYYDIQRERSSDFFIYPDYYLFHVGQSHGEHGMLDIWPPHKEVVVPDDPEEILRAINDRAITRLLVWGEVDGADVTVTGNNITESYVDAVLDRSPEIGDDVAADIRSSRRQRMTNGRGVESYRRIDVNTALALLV